MAKSARACGIPVAFEGFAGARCQDVVSFFDDFLGCTWAADADSVSTTSTTGSNTWDYTAVAGGAALACLDGTYSTPSTHGGVLGITTVATADDGANLQVAGCGFVVDQDVDLPLYFEARIMTPDVSNLDFFVGLSAVDTEIITTGADDNIGFLLEGGTLYVQTSQDSTEENTDTAITETDSQWIRVAFYFDGQDNISFYVDDDDDGEFDFICSRTVSTSTHDIPDDESLTPTIEAITGTTATAEILYVDYVLCQQQRYHA